MSKSFKGLIVVALVALFGFVATPSLAGDGFAHHVVFHVDDNDKLKMNIALNNAANVTKYYQTKGEQVQIEIVAYGPGLHMLRDDTSPVKARLADYPQSFPNVSFAACGNTINKVEKKEGKAVQLIEDDAIRVVPSGVVQLMIRQDQGWHYIRP
ncbi:hypothetical protein ACFL12_04565 [Pseudomonadota bacterium]